MLGYELSTMYLICQRPGTSFGGFVATTIKTIRTPLLLKSMLFMVLYTNYLNGFYVITTIKIVWKRPKSDSAKYLSITGK